MRPVFIAIAMMVFAFESEADIYKCGNIYANTSETRGPEELIAQGCRRLQLTTDPVSTNGTDKIIIRRSEDGHFRLEGKINKRPVIFLVDTGATFVSVSNEFAKYANLKGGKAVTFGTANGNVSGRIIEDIPVSAESFLLPNVTVAVGLVGLARNEALLGQSFLSSFEITLDDRQMIMRNKK